MRTFFIVCILMIANLLHAQQPISNKGNRNQTYPNVTAVNPEIAELTAQVSMDNLESSIRWMQNFIRICCYPAALETQNWLINQFESFGLDVYVHYFPAVDIVNNSHGYCTVGDTLDAGNVVAIQRGTEFPNEYIVISSHYDHPDGPGADDNASGTAGVVEIARILSQHSFKRTIIYVPFNAEELWMVGSFPFAEKCAMEDMNILGVFNMDMIGFFPEDVTPLTMYSGASKISECLWKYYHTVANLYVTDIPTFQFSDGDSYGGDHMPFNIYEYPALYIGDVEYLYKHPCYHKPCDTLGHGVNSLLLAQGFVKATLASVAELANGWLPPQNLSAVPADSKITISWDAAPETSTYKLFKNNVLLTETTETSYIDTDVINGTEYSYYVKGIHTGSGEESPESNRDSIAASLPLELPYFNDFENNTDRWRLNTGWERTTSEHYSENTSLTTGSILSNHFSTAELCWFSIPDTTTNVSMSFYLKGSVSGGWKESNCFIEASTDRKRWDKLMKLSGDFKDWFFCQIPLNQYIGEPFVQVRIRVESSGEDNGKLVGRLFFDDIGINFTPVVGIRENISFPNVKIIPNPSTGKVNVATGLSSTYHLAIYSMQGIKVFEKESFTNGILDISTIPKGMYILKIATKDESIAKKIVIQ